MIYELNRSGMEKLSAEGKNDLPIGTVLFMHGYNFSHYVIVKNYGIDPKWPSYGAKYLKVNLSDHMQSYVNAYELEFKANKKDERIQIYIDDKIMSEDEVKRIFEMSEKLKIKNREDQARAEEEREHLVRKGKELFNKYIPAEAQTIIVAISEQDDCDGMTDHFATIYKARVILGWSKHKRDIFSEMRKYADRIPETAHLKDPNPDYEHREKWSMGAGYYLKKGNRYDTGWKIEKHWLPCGDEWYISLAKRCIFDNPANTPQPDKKQPQNGNKPIISEYKGHPTITLPWNDKGFTFGLTKAKAILDYYEDIKAFVNNNN